MSSGMTNPLSLDVEQQVQQRPAGEAPASKRRAFGLGLLSGGLACACIAAVALANTGDEGHAQYLGKFTPGLLPPQVRAPAVAKQNSVSLGLFGGGRRAPARGAPAPAPVPDKSNYKGGGEYLDAAGVAALPTASGSPAMPGKNIGGDAMLFGETMLKDQMIPEWAQNFLNQRSAPPAASGGRGAPARGAPAQAAVVDKSNYKGGGQYLDAAGAAALPTASGSPARPGWNIGGDAMLFGEEMLKDQMVPEWEQSQEYTNWGSPLPTASSATVQAYKEAKERAALEEYKSRSRYPVGPS